MPTIKFSVFYTWSISKLFPIPINLINYLLTWYRWIWALKAYVISKPAKQNGTVKHLKYDVHCGWAVVILNFNHSKFEKHLKGTD